MFSLTLQGEDYFLDMDAEQKCEEATGNAGAQMDRCVLSLFMLSICNTIVFGYTVVRSS